jgi:NAD(P)H-dependent FMN reductase
VIRVLTIIGSTREKRYGEKAAAWIHARLGANPEITAELADLRDYPLPLFERALPPGRAKPGDYGHPVADKWAQALARADAFVVTVAEYNHGYTAVLKNAMDWVFHEWGYKPIAFVGYGGSGGARAVEQLRQVAIELQMAPIRQAVHLPLDVLRATMPLPSPVDPVHFAPAEPAADAMIERLVWWAKALAAARA